jgi:hypothetical protein
MARSPDSRMQPSCIPSRSAQFVTNIIVRMAIAGMNLQDSWAFFTKPIQTHLHISEVVIQMSFIVSAYG